MPPIYDYFCQMCEEPYEVTKSIKEYDGQDRCPVCANIGSRIFSCNIYFTGTKIEDAEYNPGLGRITKSKSHREELAKQLNVVEVGNEKPESIHKHFDQARETKRKKAYEDL